MGSIRHVVGRLEERSLDTSLSVRVVNEEKDAAGLFPVELEMHIFKGEGGVCLNGSEN